MVDFVSICVDEIIMNVKHFSGVVMFRVSRIGDDLKER